MRPANTYCGARRNAWHEGQARTGHRWEESRYRFDVKVLRPVAPFVWPNRSQCLDGKPTRHELAKRARAA